jgi:hypothetical protein
MESRVNMKIDEFLPRYDFNEVHQVTVDASPGETFAAVKDLLPSDLSPLVYLMLNLRDLPAKLVGKTAQARAGDKTFLAQLYDEGFIPLAEVKDKEIVFGLIGQFWKLTGGEGVKVTDPGAFIDFDSGAYAKVAANLLVQPAGKQTTLSTETRIWAPDEAVRKKFAFYWRLISLGSGWIRVMWLKAIKRRAERGA